jgi:hypothetical protein
MKWAIIHNNKVINNVFWSGQNDWVYPFPHDELLPNDDNTYKIGMYFENGQWKDPIPSTEVTTPDIEMVVHDLGEHLKPYLMEQELSEELLYMFSALYPEWEAGQVIEAGAIRSYKAKLYEIIQPHTTQSDWTPDVTPALWREIAPAGVIPEWKQPAGGHDAYAIGAKVTHNGFTWESTINANVWAPGVHGWKKI